MKHGPGYYRMKARLGVDNAETLRLQVLKEQAEALSAVRTSMPAKQDREGYKDYPPPKGTSKRPK